MGGGHGHPLATAIVPNDRPQVRNDRCGIRKAKIVQKVNTREPGSCVLLHAFGSAASTFVVKKPCTIVDVVRNQDPGNSNLLHRSF